MREKNKVSKKIRKLILTPDYFKVEWKLSSEPYARFLLSLSQWWKKSVNLFILADNLSLNAKKEKRIGSRGTRKRGE